MDPLQWMGAVRMGVQTADKNITSNPHHSSHQLRFCKEKICVCKKQITHEGALSPWSIIMLSLINMSRRDRFSLNNKCNLLIFYDELSLKVCACSYALKLLFYIYVSTLYLRSCAPFCWKQLLGLNPGKSKERRQILWEKMKKEAINCRDMERETGESKEKNSINQWKDITTTYST